MDEKMLIGIAVGVLILLVIVGLVMSKKKDNYTDSENPNLSTPEGHAWLSTPKGYAWLSSPAGQFWLDTAGKLDTDHSVSADWLATPGGHAWLNTMDGNYWLNTEHGQIWKTRTMYVSGL